MDNSKWTIVERRDLSSDPFHPREAVIIENRGRRFAFFQTSNFENGPVIWGLGAIILPDDTFDTLLEPRNEFMRMIDAVVAGYDDDRPLLNWGPSQIFKIIEKAEE